MFGDQNDDIRPSDSPPPDRPLTIAASFMWFFLVTSLWLMLLSLTITFRESAADDLVNRVACQAAAYAICTYLIVRNHGSSQPLIDHFGLRPTHLSLYPLGAALGIATQVPAEMVRRVIERKWPTPPEDILSQLAVLRVDTGPRRILVAVIAVCVGPVLEEFFFRGVLYRGLRRLYSEYLVVPLVGCLFAAAHLGPRIFLPILIPGLVFGFLRASSGSILPALIGHMTFNGVAIFSLISGAGSVDQDTSPLPWSVATAGVGATACLVALSLFVAKRSTLAHNSRGEDVL